MVPDRTHWIDYAKAVGIILVVYGHVLDGVMNAGIVEDLPIHNISLSIIYSFHMPLFFFLSGLFFVSSLDKKGRAGLFRNKLDALIYPFLIWSLIDGGLGVVLSEFTNRNTTWADVFSMFWMPRGQFWFLYTLFLIFSLSILVFAKLPRRYHLLILVATGLLFISKSFLPQVYPLNFIIKNWVFFVFGICFSQIKNLFIKHIRIIFPVSLLAFLSSQWYFHFKLQLLSKNADENGLALFVALASILFVVTFCMVLSSYRLKPFSLLGIYCLEIYLMHVIAGGGFRIILKNGIGIHDGATHLILGTLAGIIIPLAIGYLLKKANFHFLFTPIGNFKPSAIFHFPYGIYRKNTV